MEMLSYVSLITLIIAIVLGFLKKTNVGIIAITMAFFLGKYFGIKDKDIIKGFKIYLQRLFLLQEKIKYYYL